MSRVRTRPAKTDPGVTPPRRVHKRFYYEYRDGTIGASVVTPPKSVPDFDTIYLDMSSARVRTHVGAYLTPDEALAAAATLIEAVWHDGKRAKRWPKR